MKKQEYKRVNFTLFENKKQTNNKTKQNKKVAHHKREYGVYLTMTNESKTV